MDIHPSFVFGSLLTIAKTFHYEDLLLEIKIPYYFEIV